MAGQQNKMSSGMQERLNLSRKVTPPPLNEFDNSDAVPAPSAQALMQIQPAGLHKDIILMELVKEMCKAKGKSASKSQRLYKKMLHKLQELKVISPALIEALKQCNYSVLWKTLMSRSLSSSSGDSPDGRALVPYTPFMLPPDKDQSNFFQERYKKDFVEKERIGEGGFGKVYKVQHKLDKEHYAVKKIKVTKKKSCCFQSMQREIQTLACLNHPNVVRYHQSWFGEELHEVSEQSQNKVLMLNFRSTHDVEDSEEEEDSDGDDDSDDDDDDDCDEEGEEQDELEVEGGDPFCLKLMKGYSDEKRSGIHKPVPPSPVITEVIETKREHHSQLTGIGVSKKGTEVDLFDPDISVPFEDERFDSGELVNEFFTQTTENVAIIEPLVSPREKEQFPNILFSASTEEIIQEFDRVTVDGVRTESWESSGTSGSTVVFQNLESEDTECDDLNLPSLKEQNSTLVEFTKQSHQTEKCTKSSSQLDCDIKITAKSKSKKIVKNTIIPVTTAAAAILSTFTSSLTSSTHLRSKTQYTPSRSQHHFQNGRFSRSISWDGQESSPEVNAGYWSRSRPPFKRRYYLYIQMELCCSTLRVWLTKRNDTVATTMNQFDVVNERQNQNIYKQILEGMNYIHTQGILHRDVTPKNIFLSDKETDHLLVKIGDFGLAREDVLMEPKTPMRFQQDQDLQEYSEDPYTSQTYTSNIGTKTYAAPEQLDGTTYDNKSDMYSLGLILFELYHPFGTEMERGRCWDNLRKGNIPEELRKRWPAQYSAIRHLTRQDSRERPSASDLLAGDMFPSKDKSQADENERLKKEIERLNKLLAERDAEISQLKESRSPKK